MSIELHINIDHIASIRKLRQGLEPCLIDTIKILEKTKVKGITLHLREDRRHITDADITKINDYLENSKLKFTFEMGATEEIQNLCLQTRACLATLVPERREELTTEGGLDVYAQKIYLQEFIKKFKDKNIQVSLFIDPSSKQIISAKEIGADFVEFHTGTYAHIFEKFNGVMGAFYEDREIIINEEIQAVIRQIQEAVSLAQQVGLKVNLGHGLSIMNIQSLIRNLQDIKEIHVGYSLIANSIYYGLQNSIEMMLKNL